MLSNEKLYLSFFDQGYFLEVDNGDEESQTEDADVEAEKRYALCFHVCQWTLALSFLLEEN